MGKALLVNASPGTRTSGDEWSLFGSGGNGTEAVSQVLALTDFTLSNLRALITSGGSGTNTFTSRISGANGNNVASVAGAGVAEDLNNTDSVLAANNFNVAYTDTGTDSVIEWCSANIELATGHGCLYVTAANSGAVHDVASATRYWPLGGRMGADGNATLANVQWKLGADYTMEAWQARVQANARTNDSVMRINVNGTQVSTDITYTAAETGTKSATSLALSLNKDDLVCYDLTLSTGVEDLTINFVGSLLTSAEGKSEMISCGAGAAGTTRTASATPSYYCIGGQNVLASSEANARIRPGFEAKVEYPRINLISNTYTSDAQFEILKDGVSVLSLNLPAGVTGWIDDDALNFDIDDTDELSVSITGGGTGSIAWNIHGFTFAPLSQAEGGGTNIMSGSVMSNIMSDSVMKSIME